MHFAVMVIGEGPEEQLAPYDENAPEEQLRFIDMTDEGREAWEGTITMVELNGERYPRPDATLTTHLKAALRKRGGLVDLLNLQRNPMKLIDKLVESGELNQIQVPFKELFSSFDTFMEHWYGYEKDMEMGRHGYWANPNAKWDEYVLGGLWTGYFKLRDSKVRPLHTKVGSPGIRTEAAQKGYVDRCHVSDIDIEGMRAEARARASKRYHEFTAALSSVEDVLGPEARTMRHEVLDLIPRPWDYFDGKHTYRDYARKTYCDLPTLRVLCRAGVLVTLFNVVDVFGCTHEEYLRSAERVSLTPFAFVKDGKWYERDDIRAFELTDQKDVADWNKEFREMFDSLDPDTLVSLYDCRI